MDFGVAAYSLPCSCGFARRDGQGIDAPLMAWGVIDLAAKHGLSGIEIPLPGMLPALDEANVDQLRERLHAAHLGLVIDTGIVDKDVLQLVLPLAARAGAKTVRGVVSGILEGARASVPGGWAAHLATIERQVIAVAPLLETYDLTLALEDHQDVTSAELVALCVAGGPRIGVTLDVANPLAVGEDVLAFAEHVGPYIRNVHLKDYTIHAMPSGYRLVRAALGEGDLPWAALLALLARVAPQATLQIELAALYGRHIRVFDDDWWQSFPPTDVRAALPALRFMAQHARPADAPWHTPWELGEPFDAVAAWEQAQFARSVAFLRSAPG